MTHSRNPFSCASAVHHHADQLLQQYQLLVQLTTATKRLSTTFGEQKGFFGQPEGSFQDLTRFIIAAAYSHSMHMGRAGDVKDTDLVDWQTHQYNEGKPTKVLCFASLAFTIAAICNTGRLFHCCKILHVTQPLNQVHSFSLSPASYHSNLLILQGLCTSHYASNSASNSLLAVHAVTACRGKRDAVERATPWHRECSPQHDGSKQHVLTCMLVEQAGYACRLDDCCDQLDARYHCSCPA